MKILLEKPKVDSTPLFRLLNHSLDGLRCYYTLISALKLNIFEYLKTPKTLDRLSKECRCDKKLLLIFCRVLCKLRLVLRDGEKYVASSLAKTYLTKNSPFSQKFYVEDTARNVELWMNLPKILRRGPVKLKADRFFGERAVRIMAQHALCGELQKTVEIVSGLPEFMDARKLLDLGGGHGLYSIAFTKINPKLKAYVFDLPKVTEKTRQYIRMFKARRVYTISGNFFKDDFGDGYDIIFSSYNPGGKKISLIPKIYRSLKKGGLYINKQIFPDKCSNNPLLDLEWNLWVFDGMEKGEKIYSFKDDTGIDEYLKRLEKAGFKILNVYSLPTSLEGGQMIVCKKV
mgnify:CR=1 FL=1